MDALIRAGFRAIRRRGAPAQDREPVEATWDEILAAIRSEATTFTEVFAVLDSMLSGGRVRVVATPAGSMPRRERDGAPAARPCFNPLRYRKADRGQRQGAHHDD